MNIEMIQTECGVKFKRVGSMDIEGAKQVLGEALVPGGIGVVRNEYVNYANGTSHITLDGFFSINDLEAIVVYAKQSMCNPQVVQE